MRFRSRLRSEWLTARLGAVLGVTVTLCFVTGLVNHLHQHPVSWIALPTSPAWGFQLTQGLHVTAGLASIPLLGAKLWAVYPKLFSWPPFSSWTSAAERLSIALLTVSVSYELLTGLLDVTRLALWPFFFPLTHYAVAWMAAGSVLLHVAVRWPAIVRGLRTRTPPAAVAAATTGSRSLARAEARAADRAAAPGAVTTDDSGLSRRGVLWAAGIGAAAVAVTTAGQTFSPLRVVGLLAPRSPGDLPDQLPINRTAAEASVTSAATDPSYRLTVRGPQGQSFSLAELAQFEQVTATLPIACVDGWSGTGTWSGPRLRDVLDACSVPADATVRVVSLEPDGLYGTAEVPPQFARHPDTLLALRLDGAPLTLDHGYPVRLIAPDRPGILQTKWLATVEAL